MKRMLVVDDSTAIRKAIRRILESLGYEVDEAENGKQALTYCIEWGHVDGILLDIDMPVMDGMTFLKLLRDNPQFASVPVVMCSTHNAMSKIEEALSLGANEYIMKPFDAEIIGSKLEQLGIA
jgi:two-component system chemotaxis response regulator CheY